MLNGKDERINIAILNLRLFIGMITNGGLEEYGNKKKTHCCISNTNTFPLIFCNRHYLKCILTCSWDKDMLTGVISTCTQKPRLPSATPSF
jgi:hypothetical protein